jgi:acyl transferase domain-containing protein
MYRDGVRTFIEVGPSSVLKGLITATLGDRPHLMVALDNRGADGVTSLNIALAQLATAGHAIDFNALWADAPAPAPRPVPKPHDLLLNGANYGKPRSSRDRALPVAIDKLAPANQPAAAAPAEPERNQSEQSTTTIIRGSAAIAETQA